MSRLLLLTGGGSAIGAPLAGVDAEAFPAGLSSDTIGAPLAGSDSEAFAAGFSYGQTLLAPLAGSDAEAFAAAMAESETLLAPLAGVDAEAFPPSLPFDQTLLAPLAGLDAEAFGAALFRAQFLTAPLAESGAWVYPGAVLDDEAAAAALEDGLTVRSYSRAGALLAELDLAHAKSYTDQVDDTGAGAVTVQNDDPDYAHTGFDRVLRFLLGGQPRFASLVEGRDVTTLDPSGGAAEVTKLSGRGALALLEEGIVGPSRGVGAQPIETERSFSWPSSDFDDSGWPLAKQIMPQTQPDYAFGLVWPEIWPDSTAWWIWGDTDDSSYAGANPGTCLIRRTYTFAADTRIAIFHGFDNSGDLYVDGARVAGGDVADGPRFSRRFDIDVTAGEHVFAARVINAEHGYVGNPGRFICSVYETDESNLLGDLLLHTDSTWKCLPYVTVEPGFTNGEVWRILLAEAQAAGACTGVSLGFTDALDSAGNPWPVESEITVTVGRTLLEVAQEMAGSTADLAMAPGAHVLRAWRFGERGTTSSVTLTAGSNLAGLSHAGKRSSVNAVLVRWAGGWLEELDAPSIAANGRRSTFLDLSVVQSEGKARELARETMELRSSPRYAVSASIDPASALQAQALHALQPGDTMTHPNEAETPEAGRVRSLTVSEADDGRLDRSVRINDVAEETEVRHERWLRRMAPGALAGGSRIAVAAGRPQPSDRPVSTLQVAEFSYEASVSASSTVRLLLNGSYIGPVVTFTTGDEQKVSLSTQRVLGDVDHLQVEVDGVLSQRRPAAVSGNLIDFMVSRTASADGTAGVDAQARAI